MMPAPAKASATMPEPVKEEEGGTDISVSIIPGSGANYSLISICPPAGAKRTPSDICCVIDISWSMTMEATVQAAGGKSESNGLSMLDIAKHAVRTVMYSLGPEDRLSLVEFCRESKIVLPLTKMDQDGVRLAEESLEGIGYGNGTSLSRGLQQGLQALEESGDTPTRRDRLAHMMVLTDGETESKELVMPLLTSYAAEHGQLPCSIHCFGFGYEIDSALLTEIAAVGSGSYAFIPDAGFVGTVFVNCMSNLLVTMATDMKLVLRGIPRGTLKVLGSWEALPGAGGSQEVMIGTLQYGQSREFVCRHDGADASKLAVQLEYRSSKGTKSSVRGVAGSPDSKQLEIHRCRTDFLDTLKEAMEVASGKVTAGGKEGKIVAPDLAKAQALLKDIGSRVASAPVKDEEQVKGLLEDICGQTAEAFSCAEYWEKWGRHYAPSLHCAHQRQLCNNFKDPGVQVYGGDLFLDVRDSADEEFNKLPPPNVTHGQYKYLGKGKIVVNTSFGAAGTQPARTVNMAAYNDRYGGCIDGTCFIETPTGKPKRIADLVKGDRVSAYGGAEAEVVCVVVSRCMGQKAPLVELPGGARLTPYHPVRLEGEWRFPADLGAVVERPCEAVYSFILRGSTNLIVGGVPCIALGHGLDEGAASHPYFATQCVIKDLSTMRGFDTGRIELKQGAFHRNPNSGLVCGVSPEP